MGVTSWTTWPVSMELPAVLFVFSPWSSSLRRRGGFFEDGEVLERYIVEGGVQGVSPQTRGV